LKNLPRSKSDLAPNETFSVANILGISMASLISLGLARLAFSLLVPTMRAELGWSYESIGWMGAFLTAGYLAGAMVTPLVVSRIGSRPTFVVGLALTCCSLALTSTTRDYLSVSLLRTISGVGTAFIFVVGSTLIAASTSDPFKARLGMCVFLGAGGFGMALTAAIVPFIAEIWGWEGGWFTIALLAVIAAFAALPAVNRSGTPPRAMRPGLGESQIADVSLWPVYTSYMLFGAGYLAFATFVVAYLRFNLQFSAHEIAGYWGVAGFAGIFGSFCWLPLIGRLSGGSGIAVLNACSALGAVLCLYVQSRAAAYLSAFFFGLAFLTVAAAVLNFARRAVPPSDWTRTMSLLTVSFSLGQCFGPMLAGVAADRGVGIEGGIVGSVLLLVSATLAALFQREPELR